MTDAERRLSDAQIREIVDNDVWPLLDASPTRENPRLLIIGGPQGSGKTTARRMVAAQLDMAHAVQIEGDDLYDLLPHYDATAREHGALEAATICYPDWQELSRLTLEAVKEGRKDVVLVGPYTNAQATLQRVAEFRNERYRAELAYSAVHPAISQLSVMHRHQQAVTNGVGYSFLVPVAMQERVYKAVPEMLREAERSRTAEALHIYDRSGVRFSKQLQADGEWTPATPAAAVVEEIRNHPWTAETKADFHRRRDTVARGAGDAWAERLESVDRHAAPMLRPAESARLDADAAEASRLANLSFPGPAVIASENSLRAVDPGRHAEQERPREASPER